MAKVIAVYNIKGGVGKSTSAVNLAYLSAASGSKTLLWDMDHQGAAGFLLGIDEQLKGGLKAVVKDMQLPPTKRQLANKVISTGYENLDILPADSSLRLLDVEAAKSKPSKRFITKLLAPLLGEYDVIIIDCAPGLSLSNESMLYAADLVLVPVVPTVLAMRTLEELNLHIRNNMQDKKPKLRAFFSMMDSRKTMHNDIYQQLCVKRKTLILPIAIPYSSITEKMATQRQPLGLFAASSAPALAYAELWQSVKRIRL